MAKIPLHNRLGDVVAYTLCSRIDYAKLRKYSWHLCAGYARTQVHNGERWVPTFLTHILFPRIGKKVRDHINGDRLDNRRRNLRVTTQTVNCRNRKTTKGYWLNKYGYSVHIFTKDHRTVWLGTVSTLSAAKALRKKAEDYFWHGRGSNPSLNKRHLRTSSGCAHKLRGTT